MCCSEVSLQVSICGESFPAPGTVEGLPSVDALMLQTTCSAAEFPVAEATEEDTVDALVVLQQVPVGLVP